MKFKIYQEATELSTDTRGLFYNHTKGRASFHPPPPLPSLPRPLTSIPLPPPLSLFTRNLLRYHPSPSSYLKIASILCPLFFSPPLTLPPLPLPIHNLSLRPPRLAPYPGFLTMHLVSYPDLTRPSQATTKISVTRRSGWETTSLSTLLPPLHAPFTFLPRSAFHLRPFCSLLSWIIFAE